MTTTKTRTVSFATNGTAPKAAPKIGAIARKPAAPAAKAAPTDPIAKLLAVEAWANSKVVGRATLLRAFVLGVVGSQNSLLIGVPGTAKTLGIKLISSAFAAKGEVYRTLLTKFSKPNEVFGPTDTKALVEEGELKTKTKGFLPQAKVGVLDEVFKGSSAIMNAMLTIANEREFRNGSEWEAAPVRTMVGMSNEFPEDPVALAAFFDRFPIKLMVRPLDADDFQAMLTKSTAPGTDAEMKKPCPIQMTEADMDEITDRVAACAVSPEVIVACGDLRAQLGAKGISISDRRWVQAVAVMKANAVLAGRDTVTRRDLPVLEYVCWNTEQDLAVIRAMLPEFSNPNEKMLREIAEEVYAQRAAVLEATNVNGKDSSRPKPDMVKGASAAAKAHSTVSAIASRLDIIKQEMVDNGTDEDRELFRLAEQSIKVVKDGIIALARGKEAAVQDLLNTSNADLGG